MERKGDGEEAPNMDNSSLNGPQDDSLNNNLRDDTFNALWKHFIGRKPGKGRPPSLPAMESTTRLLLQLNLLRIEGNSTLEQMTSWYQKLFPDVDITMGRLHHKVQMLERDFLRIGNHSKQFEFLAKSINFDEVPTVLSSLGLTRPILLNGSKDFVPLKSTKVTNEIVVALDNFKSKEGLAFPFVTQWLGTLLNRPDISLSKLSYAAGKVLKEVKKLKSCKSTDKLETKLLEPLIQDSISTNAVLNEKRTNTGDDNLKRLDCLEKITKDQLKRIKLLEEKNKQYQQENMLLKEQIVILIESRDNLRSHEKELYSKIITLEDKERQISSLKEKISKLEKQCETFSLSKTYKKNTVLTKKIQEISHQLTSANERESSMKEIINNLECDLKNLKMKIKNEQSRRSKLLKNLQMTEKDLKTCQDGIEFLSKNSENDCIEIRESGRGRQFSEAVRLTYMALQGDANVSAENCSKVVQIVCNNFFNKDVKLSDLPKPSSALNFQSEAHVISKHQVMDEIKGCSHFTFACDGTSRDKEHYLEQHIVLDNGKQLSLGFSKIATDNSDTLLESTINIFMELCEIDISMSEESQLDKDVLFKDIFSKLKCLLSDRAEVMKCFDNKVAEYKRNLLNDEDASTHFVYCNAHFLLGLFSAAEKGIREIEKECGEKLGRDSCAAFYHFQDASETAALRIIRLASSAFGPRGDEKSGSRFEWLAFCSKNGVKSQFSSFRSNRFNNVFQNATALLIHKDDILKFLDGYASNSNLKLRSIVEDLKDARIISVLAALSLFHVFFTEPYWSLMNSSKTHGDFPHYVRKIEDTLDVWEDNVDIENLSSVFPDFTAIMPPNYFSLFDSFAEVSKNFSVIVKECKIVFKRQLKDFLDGGVFGGEIAPEVMSILKSCPLTNLTGERLFGDLDFDKTRRRNSSVFSNAAKVMWKRNKSYWWLSKQTNLRRQRLVAKAVKMGPEWRERSRKANREVLEKVKKRIAENREKKLGKEVKDAEMKRDVINWVIASGGLCTNKEDVDKLMKEKNRLQHIQYQIKARKLLYGESINSSGTLKTLYNRLLNHLGHDRAESAPPAKKKRLESGHDDDDDDES